MPATKPIIKKPPQKRGGILKVIAIVVIILIAPVIVGNFSSSACNSVQQHIAKHLKLPTDYNILQRQHSCKDLLKGYGEPSATYIIDGPDAKTDLKSNADAVTKILTDNGWTIKSSAKSGTVVRMVVTLSTQGNSDINGTVVVYSNHNIFNGQFGGANDGKYPTEFSSPADIKTDFKKLLTVMPFDVYEPTSFLKIFPKGSFGDLEFYDGDINVAYESQIGSLTRSIKFGPRRETRSSSNGVVHYEFEKLATTNIGDLVKVHGRLPAGPRTKESIYEEGLAVISGDTCIYLPVDFDKSGKYGYLPGNNSLHQTVQLQEVIEFVNSFKLVHNASK